MTTLQLHRNDLTFIIHTPQRLNMADETVQALAFAYVNTEHFDRE